jgi:hypothetical protein
MHGDAAYTIFFGFGIVWVLMGFAALTALLKSDNQPIRFGKWGLIVTLPVVIPFVAALVIAWMRS